MARKNQNEVQAEIMALNALLQQMPAYKSSINVSLRVLEDAMSHDDVFDAYEGNELFDDAHITLLWRDGQGGSTPSAQFREML